ncbi:putative lipid II flippase FtsW [bacterium C-53]|nr:putative lipid II flippase FtsW [Lachnospiraceae bacterium]NBI03314.1 putative lipid II flippase FtsW [Lachnospiraceae bacterium]RKJ09859.1 putative lipid II flippase FtsW [bacterium C-53]
MAGNTRKKKKAESFMDYSLLFIVIFLLAFGLIMVYSASSYESMLKFDDAGYYLKKQFFATVLGLGCMVVVTKIDYHWWAKIAKPAYLISAVLILLVLTPLGITANGARRWLNLGMSLQPAEVAKVGMIIFFADFICKAGKSIKTLKGFMITIGIAAPISLMIMTITSNLSSAIIIFGIVFLMLFVASPDYKHYVLGALIMFAVAAAVVYAVYTGLLPEELSYRLTRIKAWLNPEAYASSKGFQTLQALYSIGSGGIFGKGLGQSMQKLGYLPEAQNDMIFSIICEELGLFGATAIILLFVLLIWRFMVIANNAPDLFGALLVVGVMGHIAIQVILNIAVVTNTIPNTGITLPFISYGGSSVMFLMIEIGMVLSVSRGIRLE